MVLLLAFAFLSGLITILTPCIWPLLPIILSSSISGKSHRRPLGITLGIMLSFAIVTLAISTLVRLFHFDPQILRIIAVVVIAFLGLSMLIPKLSTILEGVISRISGKLGQTGENAGNGFLPGFITGISLGIIWSPCAGPILAAIATLAATGKITLDVILITFFYILGVGIPLFIFAFLGQQVFTRTKFVSRYLGNIQKVFGIIMLLTALAIYTNYDTYLQSQLLNKFPALNSALTNFGNNSSLQNQLNTLRGQNSLTTASQNSDLFNSNSMAPELTGGTKWLNTKNPLELSDLKGKVVLVDFWTYTCINCIRTLPHVTDWYEKYKDKGFVVIGVHTPEFEFEKDSNNVQNAIKMFNIHYPVVLDNNYSIWNNYNNQYWPAEYLIDANGNIRRIEFGEGEYDKMEMAIQELLKEAGQKVSSKLQNMLDQTPKTQLSPETYLGSDRMQYYFPNGNTGNVVQNFTLSESIPQNSFSLGGSWTITPDNAQTGANATLNYSFFADKVYLVLNPGSSKNAKVKIFLDGKLVDSSNAGADVQNGIINIDSDRLYNLIDLKGKTGAHILKLEFETQGTEVFAFTFG